MIIQTANFGVQRDVRYQLVDYKYNYSSHIHEFAELVVAIRGELTVTVDGKKEALAPGNAALILPFQVHSFSSKEKNELAIFVFSTSIIPDFFGSNAGKVGTRATFTPSPVTSFIFNERIRCAERLSLYETTGFFYFMVRDYTAQVEMIESGKVSNIAERVMKHVQEHLSEKISLTSMAQDLGYSPKYLSNCVNKLFGMSISDLVSSLRTEAAKTRLRTSEKSGLEICFECGFGSERSFHRQFKKMTGMSPRAYRQRYHGTPIAQGYVTRFDSSDRKD
ncbi:MAG: helix-turn-helix domain-containing protein [Clostridia bacterium]|nr:helix-turn-helix domain-containing protein [Clostridia bacterium]